MSDGFDYDRYEHYMSMAAHDLGVVPILSLEEARGRWGVRHLSPSEFENLASVAAQDVGLQERWRDRLIGGYHREKSRVGDEIEEFFAQVPADDQASNAYEHAA